MGQVTRINKLVIVLALKSKYCGEVGDVVVGRVVQIANKKWKIDLGAIDLAFLHINAVKLEDVQVRLLEKKNRRRRTKDERVFRRRRRCSV